MRLFLQFGSSLFVGAWVRVPPFWMGRLGVQAQRLGVIRSSEYFEGSGLESLVPQRESIAIPIEDLDPVTSSVDEEEQTKAN